MRETEAWLMAPIHDQSIRDSPAARADDTLLDDWLLDDWLGLAGYLAEAVNADDVTLDTARAGIGRRRGGRERAPRAATRGRYRRHAVRRRLTRHQVAAVGDGARSTGRRSRVTAPRGSLLAGNHSADGPGETSTCAASIASVSFTWTRTITFLMEPVRGMWSRARTPNFASEQRADSRLGQRQARSAQHRGSPEEDACDV